MHMDPSEREQLLAALAEAVGTQHRAALDRDMLVRRGAELGIPKVTLAETAKLSRRAIYNILEETR